MTSRKHPPSFLYGLKGRCASLRVNLPTRVQLYYVQQFQQHVERLSRLLSQHEPEVSLAVKIPGTGEADDEGVDEFLSSHGFEFIDASSGTVPKSPADSNGNDDESGGIYYVFAFSRSSRERLHRHTSPPSCDRRIKYHNVAFHGNQNSYPYTEIATWSTKQGSIIRLYLS